MAIKLTATYSKRLGLPGYSSHQYSVTVETELVATSDIPAESAHLYQLLQSDVDRRMLHTGFVPPCDYGMNPAADGACCVDHEDTVTTIPSADGWKCSGKQKELILKLVGEYHLVKKEVDHLACQRFGKGVRQLNKQEASGLIDELIETHGGACRQSGPGNRGNRDGRRAA